MMRAEEEAERLRELERDVRAFLTPYAGGMESETFELLVGRVTAMRHRDELQRRPRAWVAAAVPGPNRRADD